ncbi:hypothetical protein NC653_010103 [Populus alba x Populus x berolinensis]|uniref:DUF4283 domain-containing protein n=4 Tax=Populus TaxID=3689 RepID=A0A4U5QX27_POPAL|nr:hypothetical protein NC653_010099 [Populus alba x Populus x berolinensis]KAJ6999309.1 hypothetical protein NC653_010102 [Populus alba x Populus x berolinensis]KAJ6999310.1 hypothetical protein NC653_010103 [Populus alba x Populus x berolinensis]TKS15281.1 hypothetical protein D5086_0000035010 [Populus alba]
MSTTKTTKNLNNKAQTTKSTPTTTSWADRVRVSDSSTRFTLDPIPRQQAGHCLKITEQELLENTSQWTRCIVGFFPGFKMPFHAVNAIASRAWCPFGLENVMTTTNGFMLFRFKTEEDLHAVLEKGPWMFGGKNIILQQWHPRFKFDKSKISTLPVWIRLHGLPFPLWSKQGLSKAASMVGRPLSCDALTYSCTRLDYARLCVELDASLPFIHSFDIDCPLSAEPITVTVDYEWKPSRCGKCNVFGHSCPIPSIPNPTISPATNDQPSPRPLLPTPTILPLISATDALIDKPNIVTLPDVNIPIEANIQTTLTFPIPTTIQPTSPIPQNIPVLPLSPNPLPLSPPQIIIDPLPAQTNPAPMHILRVLEDDSASSKAEDNTFEHHYFNAHECVESKMDSLRTISDTSSTAIDTLGGTSSTAIETLGGNSPTSAPRTATVPQSPSPSPKTVRKKKGGRKRKEAKGH